MSKLKLKKLTIKRSFWGRAPRGKHLTGQLYSPVTGKMCCLGFYCRYISKIPKRRLLNLGLPSDAGVQVFSKVQLAAKSLETDLVSLNDRVDPSHINISEKEQERLIAEGFKRINCEVIFVD